MTTTAARRVPTFDEVAGNDSYTTQELEELGESLEFPVDSVGAIGTCVYYTMEPGDEREFTIKQIVDALFYIRENVEECQEYADVYDSWIAHKDALGIAILHRLTAIANPERRKMEKERRRQGLENNIADYGRIKARLEAELAAL